MIRQILIADDDPVVRHILSAILSGSSYQIQTVENGEQCLEVVRAAKDSGTVPDVVFLDVQLPDMPGTEVLTKLRALTAPNPVRVISLSANPKEDVLAMQPDFSPDYYLEKPFVAETVFAALESLTGSRC